MQFLADLGDAILGLEVQGTCVVPGGDFNFAWSEEYSVASCGGNWAAAWKDCAKSSRRMVNAAEGAMNGPASTFLRGGSMDNNDMFFMRPEVAAMALAGVGVLDSDSEDRAPTDS